MDIKKIDEYTIVGRKDTKERNGNTFVAVSIYYLKRDTLFSFFQGR